MHHDGGDSGLIEHEFSFPEYGHPDDQTPCFRSRNTTTPTRPSLVDRVKKFSCTFFKRCVADLVRPVALGRDERFGPRAGRIGHRARDHALAVLGDGT